MQARRYFYILVIFSIMTPLPHIRSRRALVVRLHVPACGLWSLRTSQKRTASRHVFGFGQACHLNMIMNMFMIMNMIMIMIMDMIQWNVHDLSTGNVHEHSTRKRSMILFLLVNQINDV